MKRLASAIESIIVFNSMVGFAFLRAVIWIGEVVAAIINFILAVIFVMLVFKGISILSSGWQSIVIRIILFSNAAIFVSVISLYFWKKNRLNQIYNKFFSK